MDELKKPPLVLTEPPQSVVQLEKLQQQRFQNLLKFTLKHSEFYRRHFCRCGINENNVDEISVKDLPPVNKSLLMDHFNEVVCDRNLEKKSLEEFIANPGFWRQPYRGIYRVCYTSGFPRQPALFVYGPEEMEFIGSMILNRQLRRTPPGKEKIRTAGYMTINGHYAGVSKLLSLPQDLFDLRLYSIKAPTAEIVQALNEFQPHAIVGYSSGVGMLACQQLQGNLSIQPRQITCGGDHLTTYIRQNTQKAFGITPKNTYSCTQSLMISASCPQQQIHVLSDWNILEILDEKMQPLPAGKEGRLYLTNLYNYTQPLIRYETNDRLVLSGKRCDCGQVFPVLEKISGRQEEFLPFEKKDGTYQLLPPAVMVDFFVPGLKKLQMIQGENNCFTLKVVLENAGGLKLVENRMRNILREFDLDQSVTFTVQMEENIENDKKTGKFRLIVPFQERDPEMIQ